MLIEDEEVNVKALKEANQLKELKNGLLCIKLQK